MNKISLQIVINSVRSRVDGSLGLSMSTPELETEEKVEVMKLHGQILQAVFIPLDTPDVPEYKINTDLEQRTPSQRLRGKLYRLWEQSGSKDTFENFYVNRMEKFIDAVKEKLI